MLRQFSGYRRTLQGLTLTAVLVLCSGQVLADQHLHEPGALEEICSLCGCFESGLAARYDGSGIQAIAWLAVTGAEAPDPLLVARHFEIPPPRAPPRS